MGVDMSTMDFTLDPHLSEDPAVRREQLQLVSEIKALAEKSVISWTDDTAIEREIREKGARLKAITPPWPAPAVEDAPQEPAPPVDAPAS